MSEPVGRFRRYRDLRLGPKKLALIERASPIIERYEAAGYAMTLRQLHYQLVALGIGEYPTRSPTAGCAA
jgi:hypothetical protein